MKIIVPLCFMFLLLTVSVSAQTATKIDWIGHLPGDDLINRMSGWFQSELNHQPQNKLYVIYYEGQKQSLIVYNKRTKKYRTILKNPRFGDALNRAKEIPFYLKRLFKVPTQRIVLLDGGFRDGFSMEIWSVPKGAEVPKATPSLERKNIKIVKGTSYKTRTGCGIY